MVALVVTIIVLIILATIAIRVVVGERGLIWQSNNTKYLHESQVIKERLDLQRPDVAIEHGENVPIDDYIKELEEEGLIVPEETEEVPSALEIQYQTFKKGELAESQEDR